MGIWESALILLGIGIVSERFGAGTGLGELGTGIRSLVSAPLGGLGSGLGEFSGGLRSFGEAIGDIGRGFGTFFEAFPDWLRLPEQQEGQRLPRTDPSGNGNGALVPDSGGDATTYLTGGGGHVPTGGPILTLGTTFGPMTGTFATFHTFYLGKGLTETQVHSLLDPHFNKAGGGVGGYRV